MHFHYYCIPILFLFACASAKSSSLPRALVLPVSKDASSLQYVTQIQQRTPLVSVNLTADLGGLYLWVDCDRGYVSSSYRPARCGSSPCSLAAASRCNNNTCVVNLYNEIAKVGATGKVSTDVVSLASTNGSNPGPAVSVPQFIFACGSSSLLKGLASGVTGMAGLGRNQIALPSQFAAAFGFPARKFALCLSSSTRSSGVVFFGDGPYHFLPNNVIDHTSLTYTPLLNNHPKEQEGSAGEYFINVTQILVGNKSVPLDASLLSINSDGVGGTKLSTINPYTVMERSIYKAFTSAFAREMGNGSRVAPVAPFTECFKGLSPTRVGPAVPAVNLVLGGGRAGSSVLWWMYGANSMVDVGGGVVCLGFVDGGVRPTTSIVIGGQQLEDNVLEFDLKASRLGFTSSLLFQRTTCANFNFTAVA